MTEPHVLDAGRAGLLVQILRRHHIDYDILNTGLRKRKRLLQLKCSRVDQNCHNHGEKLTVHAHKHRRPVRHLQQLDRFGPSNGLTVPVHDSNDTADAQSNLVHHLH